MYELKPYICFALALWATQMEVVMQSSYAPFAKLMAMSLIFLGGMVIFMRGSHRGYFS